MSSEPYVRRPPAAPDPLGHRYAEALALLGQLRTVTRELPGTLDPEYVANAVLDDCAAVVSFSRAAMLVRAGPDQLVPLAVRGMRRVPWRHPLTTPGPLNTAWQERRPVLDSRPPDADGRRSGSALLALPMQAGEEMLGLTVLESARPNGLPPAAIAAAEGAVAAGSLRLAAALLFDELRMYAGGEERERLAREMHDGVAQDLASVGFELDALRHRIGSDADAAAADALRLRRRVTEMISDIRLSITDLKSSIGPSRGLGAALTSYARTAATGSGLTVHLTLTESSFRLPTDTEVELLRAAQEVTAGARRQYGADNLWVLLQVDPPSALLRLEHDGAALQPPPEDADQIRQRISRVGGTLRVRRRRPAGVCIEIEIGASRA